jgi:ABC-type spermidine/putrescine transport system permease subunit I
MEFLFLWQDGWADKPLDILISADVPSSISSLTILKATQMKKQNITSLFLISLTLAIISSLVINKIILNGYLQGGANISRMETINARLNPDSYYWQIYPYSLVAGLVVGVLVFVIGYMLTLKRKE